MLAHLRRLKVLTETASGKKYTSDYLVLRFQGLKIHISKYWKHPICTWQTPPNPKVLSGNDYTWGFKGHKRGPMFES